MRKSGRGAQWKLNSPEAFALQGFPKDPVWMDPWLAPLRSEKWLGGGRGGGAAGRLILPRGVASFHGAGPWAKGGAVGGLARGRSGWVSEQSPPGKGGLIPFSGHSYLSYPSLMPGSHETPPLHTPAPDPFSHLALLEGALMCALGSIEL